MGSHNAGPASLPVPVSETPDRENRIGLSTCRFFDATFESQIGYSDTQDYYLEVIGPHVPSERFAILATSTRHFTRILTPEPWCGVGSISAPTPESSKSAINVVYKDDPGISSQSSPGLAGVTIPCRLNCRLLSLVTQEASREILARGVD